MKPLTQAGRTSAAAKASLVLDRIMAYGDLFVGELGCVAVD